MEKLLLPYNFRSSSDAHRVVKYAPRYKLAFTLLNEDTSSGNAAISWELEDAIHSSFLATLTSHIILIKILEYLDPTLHRLSVLHNFTIESQVQFHAPLAFTPRALEQDGRSAYGLTQEDLTVFVNSAEWTLCKSNFSEQNYTHRQIASSVSNDPVLHFVLFIPSSKNSPLYIIDQSGKTCDTYFSFHILTARRYTDIVRRFYSPSMGWNHHPRQARPSLDNSTSSSTICDLPTAAPIPSGCTLSPVWYRIQGSRAIF